MVKNRVEERIENAVVQMAFENPALGQVRVSNELRKMGIMVWQGGVRSIWLRHDLETFQKRLKALSAKVEQEDIQLYQPASGWPRRVDEQYNTERTHSGKYCFGKKTMLTFIEGVAVARRYDIQQ